MATGGYHGTGAVTVGPSPPPLPGLVEDRQLLGRRRRRLVVLLLALGLLPRGAPPLRRPRARRRGVRLPARSRGRLILGGLGGLPGLLLGRLPGLGVPTSNVPQLPTNIILTKIFALPNPSHQYLQLYCAKCKT